METELSIPEGVEWNICSHLKAHPLIISSSSNENSAGSEGFLVSRKQAAEMATEKAAELPNPAPIGIADLTIN